MRSRPNALAALLGQAMGQSPAQCCAQLRILIEQVASDGDEGLRVVGGFEGFVYRLFVRCGQYFRDNARRIRAGRW